MIIIVIIIYNNYTNDNYKNKVAIAIITKIIIITIIEK